MMKTLFVFILGLDRLIKAMNKSFYQQRISNEKETHNRDFSPCACRAKSFKG